MKKIAYIDFAKGYGILLIIFAHCIQYFTPMHFANVFVCSFHVPVFFMISGMLKEQLSGKEITTGELAKKRLFSLIVPFVIFSLFNSFLKLGVLTLTHQLTMAEFQDEMIDLFIKGNGTVWFLQTLFLAEILFSLVRKQAKKWLLCAALFLFAYGMQWININPFGIVAIRVTLGTAYIILGYMLAPFIKKITSVYLDILLMLLCFAVNIVTVYFLNPSYIYYDASLGSIEYTLIPTVTGSLGLVFLCRALETFDKEGRFRFTRFLGSKSLGIMLVHPTVLLVFTYLFNSRIFEKAEGILGILIALALFVIVTAITLPVVLFIYRFFPWAFGVVNEKKKVPFI